MQPVDWHKTQSHCNETTIFLWLTYIYYCNICLRLQKWFPFTLFTHFIQIVLWCYTQCNFGPKNSFEAIRIFWNKFIHFFSLGMSKNGSHWSKKQPQNLRRTSILFWCLKKCKKTHSLLSSLKTVTPSNFSCKLLYVLRYYT